MRCGTRMMVTCLATSYGPFVLLLLLFLVITTVHYWSYPQQMHVMTTITTATINVVVTIALQSSSIMHTDTEPATLNGQYRAVKNWTRVLGYMIYHNYTGPRREYYQSFGPPYCFQQPLLRKAHVRASELLCGYRRAARFTSGPLWMHEACRV